MQPRIMNYWKRCISLITNEEIANSIYKLSDEQNL